MANWFMANRALLGSKLGINLVEQIGKKTGIEILAKQGAKRIGIEFLAKKIGPKIAGTLIEKFIVTL